MGKMLVEVCLISARGLRRGPSLLKHQWYAVGWFDPDNKYCTTIDVSRTDNPVWRTKFSASLDDSGVQDSTAALHVEVYSREPIFLREKLQGTATVVLKEFLAKYSNKRRSSMRSEEEEVGSFQLRRKNSNKPHGFVDVSIRISAEREEFLGSFTGDVGGIVLNTNSDSHPEIKSFTEGAAGSGEIHLSGPSKPPPLDPVIHPNNRSNAFPVPQYYRHPHPPMQYPPSNMNPPMPRPGYPPPPPPSHAGYIPTFLPRSENFIDMPSSSSSGRPAAAAGPGYVRPGPAFAAGVGAGALAAGAVILGDNFMSGFDMPSTLPHASLTISADPPF
ncbi:PREDICTED: uncharacterized protein LOC104824373 [Tarenaya hassleriana]|uniref:uncharacterized protein LOC104824373 n=1 Tax=Tarenaya hassleriana TaxID=28532 RepID=UPI00053CA981|nr:PREDICTED: uncharacterized protein LOC104824373 [Tarenaya hassleriana]